MATFNFNVKCEKKCIIKRFHVLVNNKKCKSGSYTLSNNECIIIEFKNTDGKHGYINWDQNDPGDGNTNSRNHLKDIDDEKINDFDKINFYLFKVKDNIFKWCVACKSKSEDIPPVDDSTVTVTFGEDQPPTAELPPNDANVTTS